MVHVLARMDTLEIRVVLIVHQNAKLVHRRITAPVARMDTGEKRVLHVTLTVQTLVIQTRDIANVDTAILT